MAYFLQPTAHPRAPSVLVDMAAELREVPFTPHRLLADGHLQALLSQRPRSQLPSPAPQRRTVELANGAILHGDYVPGPRAAPLVVCIHGMGGTSSSGYMSGLARRAQERGWGALMLSLYDHRAPSDGPPTLFHAGNSAAVAEVIDAASVLNDGPIVVVGVSLGGNCVLKLLGEWGANVPSRVAGAALLSPLVDLVSSWRTLERRSRLPYKRHFLAALGALVEEHRHRLEQHVEFDAVVAATTLRHFDAAFTVPLGGYRDVFDYYDRASACHHVSKIDVPTLILFSADDPVLPVAPLLRDQFRRTPSILAGVTTRGGHVGFMERGTAATKKRGDRAWAEDRAMSFFSRLTK